MADTPQVQVPIVAPIAQSEDSHGQVLAVEFQIGPIISTFKMRGRDAGRSPGSDYIVWIFTGAEPDFAGTEYAGGTPTPIGALIVGSVIKVVTLGLP